MRYWKQVSIVAVIAVAGCSTSPLPPESVESLDYREYDSLAQQRQIEHEDFTASGFVIDEEHLALLLFGSSSCPPAPVSVKEKNGDLLVNTKDYGDTACTADYGPSAYRVTLPSGFDVTEEFLVIIDGQKEHSVRIAPLS